LPHRKSKLPQSISAMSRNKPSPHSKRTGTGSKDLSSVKADGFPNGEGDMGKRPKQQTIKREWVDPRVNPEPINLKNPTQTTEEFMDEIASKMAESIGVPVGLPDYESPSYSSARIHMQAMKETSEIPVPREDEARPCALCESRRPIGKSYSRVYCTKTNARYCKCSYCGHTWTQERK
jgi:hypothetical protein